MQNRAIHPDRYCVHQVTLMEQCDFRESLEALSRHGIHRTAVWKDKLDGLSLSDARHQLDNNGVEAIAYCVGGLFCFREDKRFRQAMDDNRQRIEQALALGATSMVVITGGVEDFGCDLRGARLRMLEGLGELTGLARDAGLRLALEPLHPMVCGNRSVLTTLGEANNALDQLDSDDVLSIALDTYACWWDPNLEADIKRAAHRISNLHVSDWLLDTTDTRLDRGMPGDGIIDNRRIRGLLEAQGFTGAVEVEIFSARNWWKRPADDVLHTILERYATAL